MIVSFSASYLNDLTTSSHSVPSSSSILLIPCSIPIGRSCANYSHTNTGLLGGFTSHFNITNWQIGLLISAYNWCGTSSGIPSNLKLPALGQASFPASPHERWRELASLFQIKLFPCFPCICCVNSGSEGHVLAGKKCGCLIMVILYPTVLLNLFIILAGLLKVFFYISDGVICE